MKRNLSRWLSAAALLAVIVAPLSVLVGFTVPGKGDYGKDLADMLNSVHTAE